MKRFHVCFAIAQCCCVLMLVLIGTGVVPKGIFATPETEQTEYLLNIICIIQTLVAVPLVVHRLQKHATLRLLVILGVILYALLCYQFTLSTTGLLCAAIAYLTLWYVYATTLRRHRQL
ncbi:MAG: hypothetical protein K5778_03295 [Bacteroidaceae bacterium]|nr:hypothetical protein [Bacteroidaceae bacterium]